MFFDKSKGAFRAGSVTGNQWDDANVGDYSFAAGFGNIASGSYSAVSGGWDNTASGSNSIVSGGELNIASGYAGIVSGGIDNTASESYSIVSGGRDNTASGYYSTVSGGRGNTTSGSYSTILGGWTNTANGDYNLVFGNDVDPSVTENYRVYFFDAAAPGMLSINRENADHPIHVGTDGTNGNGAHLTAGGTWTSTSSITKKDRFEDLDDNILNSIMQLPVKKWSYKNTNECHIGPFAEDFFRLFGTGDLNNNNANQYLSTMDVAGVSLRGVQVLIEENRELKQELTELKKMMQDLMKKLDN